MQHLHKLYNTGGLGMPSLVLGGRPDRYRYSKAMSYAELRSPYMSPTTGNSRAQPLGHIESHHDLDETPKQHQVFPATPNYTSFQHPQYPPLELILYHHRRLARLHEHYPARITVMYTHYHAQYQSIRFLAQDQSQSCLGSLLQYSDRARPYHYHRSECNLAMNFVCLCRAISVPFLSHHTKVYLRAVTSFSYLCSQNRRT